MADGENNFDMLKTTKTLLNIKDNTQDEVLQVYINMTESEILNYCNISILPSALLYPLCSIVADVYRENMAKNDTGEIVGNVSSISEDGRTVTFSPRIKTESINSSIKTKILGVSQINRFKKLYRL